MKEFNGSISLTAKVHFVVTAKNSDEATAKIFNDIQALNIVLEEGSAIQISDIEWDLIEEARRGNVSQPHIQDFYIEEEKD